MARGTEAAIILEHHIRLAEGLAKMFHPLLEAVVHDYRSKVPGVIAIFGNHVTGRTIGDPLTDLGRSRLRGRSVPDDLIGYAAQSSNGRPLKSSSFALRTAEGKVIGALCLNLDLTIFSEVQHLTTLLTTPSAELPISKVERFRSRAAGDEVTGVVQSLVREKGRSLRELTQKDREEIVQQIAHRGYFSRRGSVSTVAKLLRVTRPTIYRYIQNIK